MPDRNEKVLVKLVVREPVENVRVLRRLIRRYKPNSAQFYTRLSHQQIAALKRAYGERIAIIWGWKLKNDPWDMPPPDMREEEEEGYEYWDWV